jgi:hypothetical protein
MLPLLAQDLEQNFAAFFFVEVTKSFLHVGQEIFISFAFRLLFPNVAAQN